MAKKKEKKPSSDYWKKRFSDLENAQNQYGQQTFHQIEPAFDKAQAQIQSQIESWYQRYATNNGISMAEARKQLSAAELKELKWDVQEYIKYGQENAIDQRWMTELENASARFHISRLEALKLRSQQALEIAFGNEQDSIDSMLKQMYQSGYYHTCFEVQKGFNIGWEIGQIDEKKLQKVISKPWATDGKTFSDRVWNSKTQMVGDLHQQLTRTIIQGKAPDEAIKSMTKYLNDKTKNAKYQAGRLVMTESAFISSAAQKDAFNELDVEEFEIVATLDSRTSEICQEMDGQHFPMKDFEPGVTAPPFHVYCRSTTVPYFDDEWSGGERAARGEDGKTYYVPSDMKYPEWKESLVGGDTSDFQEVVPDDTIKVKEPTAKTIDDCQTTDDVVDLFKTHDDWFYETEINGKNFKSLDKIDLKNVDLECAKATYRPFEKLFDKFPQLKGQLNSVNSAQLGGNVMAQCSFGFGHGGVAVNTKYYGSIEKLTKAIVDSEATGFHPKGLLDVDSIVMHELGHALDDWLTYSKFAAGMNGWKPKIVSSKLRPQVMKACGLKVSDIYSEVSGYATKDAQEWFAECFAEYMCSENPRPVAKEFGKQLEEILKGVE